jgi:hypothetical protein
MLLIKESDFDYAGRSSADDEIDFWTIPDPASVFFAGDETKAELMDELFSDYLNIGNQRAKLEEATGNAHFSLNKYKQALDTIEKKIAKLLGSRVYYKSDI